MKIILADSSAVSSIDLPNRLGVLDGCLPGALTIDAVIQHHTLAPYYTAFLPSETRAAIYDRMRGMGGDLHLISGLSAFRTGRITRLRFCPDCIREMRETWGSPHWRRDHQLPSVLVCPTHNTVLRISTVDLAVSNRHGFIAATDASCPSSAECVTRTVAAADRDALLRLATASAHLLEQSGGPLDLEELSAFYRDALRAAGLMRTRMTVNQVALEEAFMERFDGILGRFPGVLSPEGLQGGWLASLARKQRNASHPLQHLLLRDLLTSRAVFEDPFGTGPWPCRNPLADHHGEHVVTDLRTYRNRSASVAIFSCRCGYRYTRSLSSSGVIGPCRFKEFGPLLRPALQEMVDEGIPLCRVAVRLGVDPKTVATLAIKHGVEISWGIRPSSRRASRDVPVEIVTIRPQRHQAKGHSMRDWRAMDLRLAGQVQEAAASIRLFSPPTRLTTSALERRLLGRRGWIAKRRTKLPRTCAALLDATESLSDFQVRRIDYWIAHQAQGAEPMRAWKIMRLAGLRGDCLPLVDERIEAHRAASNYRLSAK